MDDSRNETLVLRPLQPDDEAVALGAVWAIVSPKIGYRPPLRMTPNAGVWGSPVETCRPNQFTERGRSGQRTSSLIVVIRGSFKVVRRLGRESVSASVVVNCEL